MDTKVNVECRTHEWDGNLLSSGLNPDSLRERNQLANAVQNGDWDGLLGLLNEHKSLVNSVRPDGRTWFTPLHQAAYMNAPQEVVRRLIALGAFRTLRNKAGKRPVDIARQRRFAECTELLEPELLHPVDPKRLGYIQEMFYGLVRTVLMGYNIKERLRFPELCVLTEFDADELWFPVPGMYGGFNLRLIKEDRESVLISEHWCRAAGGSGMRHRITPYEVVLLERGFV